MKRWTELTDAELAALTEDQIQTLTEIEIMHAGIAPVAAPAKPDLASVGIVADQVGFKVGGLIFVNEQDAKTVAGMDLLDEKSDYTIGWAYKWFEPCVDKLVSKVTAYTQEAVMRCAKALQDNEQKRRPYERAQNEYTECLRKTGDIRQRIRSAVLEAVDKRNEIDIACATLERYKTLANGDTAVAESFFRNTYKDRPEIVTAVLGCGAQESPA